MSCVSTYNWEQDFFCWKTFSLKKSLSHSHLALKRIYWLLHDLICDFFLVKSLSSTAGIQIFKLTVLLKSLQWNWIKTWIKRSTLKYAQYIHQRKASQQLSAPFLLLSSLMQAPCILRPPSKRAECVDHWGLGNFFFMNREWKVEWKIFLELMKLTQ